MIKLNKNPNSLQIGTKVVTDFNICDKGVIRKITKIEIDTSTGSGYRASADGGECCSKCKKKPARAVIDVDAAWFIKAFSKN